MTVYFFCVSDKKFGIPSETNMDETKMTKDFVNKALNVYMATFGYSFYVLIAGGVVSLISFIVQIAVFIVDMTKVL